VTWRRGETIVDQDRSWRLTDEDELATFVGQGVFDAELAARVHAEALAVAAKEERDEPPFSDPLHDWRPDPSWGRPVLPDGWNRIA
jgi:hypothetical protein